MSSGLLSGDDFAAARALFKCAEIADADRLEPQIVTRLDEKRIFPLRRIEPLRRATEHIPARRHDERRDDAKSATDQDRAGRMRQPRLQPSRDDELIRQTAKIELS